MAVMYTLLRKHQAYIQVIAHTRWSSSNANLRCFKEIRVPVPWGHIAAYKFEVSYIQCLVKQWGERALPPILCCHGYLDNAAVYDNLIPLLSEQFSYFAMDYPGHGLSSHTPTGLAYTDEFFCQSMNYVQRFLGWQKTGLIGHSMGGALALIYPFWYQKTIQFVIPIEFMALPENPIVPRIMHLGRRIDKVIGQESKRLKEPSYPFEKLVSRMYAAWGGSIDYSAARIFIKRGSQMVGDLYRLTRDLRCQNNQLLGQNTYTIIKPLPEKQDVQYCFIEATGGIRFFPAALCRETLNATAENNRSVEFHTIRGKHHMLMTHPHHVAPIINQFLQRAAPIPTHESFST